MKYQSCFIQTSEGEGRLRLPGRRPMQVMTVQRAGRVLGRSRRQVYRYIADGTVPAAGKLLGEWLVERASVERLTRSPMKLQPVPARLAPLFPEYDLRRLNAGRDRSLLLSRILEQGGLPELRWAFKRFGRKELARFVREEGARRLSPRSLRLWSLQLKVEPAPGPAWRRADPWLSR